MKGSESRMEASILKYIPPTSGDIQNTENGTVEMGGDEYDDNENARPRAGEDQGRGTG